MDEQATPTQQSEPPEDVVVESETPDITSTSSIENTTNNVATSDAKDETTTPEKDEASSALETTSTTNPQPEAKPAQPLAPPHPSDEITSDQISELKKEAIEFAKEYAKTGTSTRKEPSPGLANDQGPYSWWEQQATFESDTWSISLWEYDNGNWQLQATKVELQPDGRSRMVAYSMRKDNDPNFPGFQVYREQNDDRYHPAAIEDVVYLNRVLKALKKSEK